MEIRIHSVPKTSATTPTFFSKSKLFQSYSSLFTKNVHFCYVLLLHFPPDQWVLPISWLHLARSTYIMSPLAIFSCSLRYDIPRTAAVPKLILGAHLSNDKPNLFNSIFFQFGLKFPYIFLVRTFKSLHNRHDLVKDTRPMYLSSPN